MPKGHQPKLLRRIELRDDFMRIAMIRDVTDDPNTIRGLTKLLGLISSLLKEEELKHADI